MEAKNRFYIDEETVDGETRYRAVYPEGKGDWNYDPDGEYAAQWDLLYAYQQTRADLTEDEYEASAALYETLHDL